MSMAGCVQQHSRRSLFVNKAGTLPLCVMWTCKCIKWDYWLRKASLRSKLS